MKKARREGRKEHAASLRESLAREMALLEDDDARSSSTSSSSSSSSSSSLSLSLSLSL